MKPSLVDDPYMAPDLPRSHAPALTLVRGGLGGAVPSPVRPSTLAAALTTARARLESIAIPIVNRIVLSLQSAWRRTAAHLAPVLARLTTQSSRLAPVLSRFAPRWLRRKSLAQPLLTSMAAATLVFAGSGVSVEVAASGSGSPLDWASPGSSWATVMQRYPTCRSQGGLVALGCVFRSHAQTTRLAATIAPTPVTPAVEHRTVYVDQTIPDYVTAPDPPGTVAGVAAPAPAAPAPAAAATRSLGATVAAPSRTVTRALAATRPTPVTSELPPFSGQTSGQTSGQSPQPSIPPTPQPSASPVASPPPTPQPQRTGWHDDQSSSGPGTGQSTSSLWSTDR